MDGPPSVDEFLAGTDNYDGVVDMTGSETVSIDVGVEANGAFYGFGPAAVRVDSGTEVIWTWTGQGGVHNVVARHGAEFESEQMSGEGETFSQTFEESGTALYVCDPHEGIGMKGAVVVE
jgi:halocyanin-like protein